MTTHDIPIGGALDDLAQRCATLPYVGGGALTAWKGVLQPAGGDTGSSDAALAPPPGMTFSQPDASAALPGGARRITRIEIIALVALVCILGWLAAVAFMPPSDRRYVALGETTSVTPDEPLAEAAVAQAEPEPEAAQQPEPEPEAQPEPEVAKPHLRDFWAAAGTAATDMPAVHALAVALVADGSTPWGQTVAAAANGLPADRTNQPDKFDAYPDLVRVEVHEDSDTTKREYQRRHVDLEFIDDSLVLMRQVFSYSTKSAAVAAGAFVALPGHGELRWKDGRGRRCGARQLGALAMVAFCSKRGRTVVKPSDKHRDAELVFVDPARFSIVHERWLAMAKAEAPYRAGRKALREQQGAAALQQFDAALEALAGYGDPTLWRHWAQLRNGQLDEADKGWRALALQANSYTLKARAHVLGARIALLRGAEDDALARLQTAAELDPWNPDPAADRERIATATATQNQIGAVMAALALAEAGDEGLGLLKAHASTPDDMREVVSRLKGAASWAVVVDSVLAQAKRSGRFRKRFAWAALLLHVQDRVAADVAFRARLSKFVDSVTIPAEAGAGEIGNDLLVRRPSPAASDSGSAPAARPARPARPAGSSIRDRWKKKFRSGN